MEGIYLMPQEPLVSVCMPCHNAERYVGEAIESVLNQTYKNIELIVVNDGSTDQSGKVLGEVQDKRVKVITEKCGSASRARNRAFAEAKGDYIKFFDADDLMSPKMIEKQVACLEEKQDEVAMSEWGRFFHDDIQTFKKTPQTCWKTMAGVDWLIEALMDAQPMMQAGMFLIPMELAKKTGPWIEKSSPNDDFEYFCRLFSAAKRVVFTPETVLYYRSGIKKSLSQKKDSASLRNLSEFTLLGVSHILQRNQSTRAKIACANMCQQIIYDLYPSLPEARKALQKIVDHCGGSSIQPLGGRYFSLLKPLVGWKLARKLQRAVGK